MSPKLKSGTNFYARVFAFVLLTSPAIGGGIDETPPVIRGLKDVLLNAPAGSLSDPVNSYGFFATDDIDPSPSLSFDPPEFDPEQAAGPIRFPIGATGLTCTATDASGNETVETFYVVVREIQPSPMLRTNLRTIGLRGEIAPRGSTSISEGATILGFNHVFINNNRQMLIEATLTDSNTGVALFTADCDGLTDAIVAKGDPTPAGGIYQSFNRLAISDNDVTSYEAITSSSKGEFTADGAIAAAVVGEIAPGSTNDAKFGLLQQPSASTSGLYVPVHLEIGSGSPPVTANNNSGIWDSAAGAPVVLEGENVNVAGLPPTATYGNLNGPRMVSNQAGEIAFSVALNGVTGGNITLFSGKPPNYSVVIRDGELAPDGGGATIAGFRTESISETGKTMWRSNLQSVPGLVESYNNEALYTNRHGYNELIVREHDLAPCVDPPALFNRFKELFIGGDNTVAFMSTLLHNVSVNSANDTCIWRNTPDGRMHLVAREGDVAPSTAGSIFTILSSMTANNTGGIAYVGQMAVGTGDTNSTNSTALFLDRGPESVPEMVLRKGDTIEVSPGEFRTLLAISLDITFHPHGGSGGPGRVLNDHGDLVARLSFNGGVSGVFLIPPPFIDPMGVVPPLAGLEHSDSLTRISAPRDFERTIGVQYSQDMSPGSWIDIGVLSPDGHEAAFFDRDVTRIGRRIGFYRSVLRTPPSK